MQVPKTAMFTIFLLKVSVSKCYKLQGLLLPGSATAASQESQPLLNQHRRNPSEQALFGECRFAHYGKQKKNSRQFSLFKQTTIKRFPGDCGLGHDRHDRLDVLKRMRVLSFFLRTSRRSWRSSLKSQAPGNLLFVSVWKGRTNELFCFAFLGA